MVKERVTVFNANSNNFQFYPGGLFYWWENRSIRGENTDLQQVTDKLYHIELTCIDYTSP